MLDEEKRYGQMLRQAADELNERTERRQRTRIKEIMFIILHFLLFIYLFISTWYLMYIGSN